MLSHCVLAARNHVDLTHYPHVVDAVAYDIGPIVRVVCTCIGVALDDLVYICTKIARQMDSNGLSKVLDAAETATSAIEEARPLLENAVKLVDEVCLCSRSLCKTRVHTHLALQYNLAINQGNHKCAFAFTHVDLAVSTV